MRSFVSLRNECAHHGRLWNDVSKNPPSIPKHLLRPIKKSVGQFDAKSRFHTFAALDRYEHGRVPGAPSLLQAVQALMGTNQDFAQGLLNPRPY